MNKLILGLTGGIASGKSAAARILKELGCGIVDTDLISREITAAGAEGYKKLLDIFPQAFFDGVLDRSKLKEIVFNDKTALDTLNLITHPLIRKRAAELCADSKENIVIMVVPLLFEAGFDKDVHKTCTVVCSEETRIQRLTERDNITKELARKILSNQLTDNGRIKKADYVIDNNGDFENLKKETDVLYKTLLNLF